MKFGSVCSGIEAASVAFEPLGWKAAWFSEIEPFPCAVLKHHYPDTPNHGDMTTLPKRIKSREVEAPDLFCGGTPCQAFSVAGLRQSLSDDRGNLSLTFCEIANAIDDVRLARGEPPAIIFWENVPGVLSTTDNAFGCFLGALSGCDTPILPGRLGWTDAGVVAGPQRTVAWRVLDAQYFGLAQRRRRVFVVASARDGFNPAEVLLEFQGLRRDFAPSREAGQRPTGSVVARTGRNGGASNQNVNGGMITGCWWDGSQVTDTLTTNLFGGEGAQRMPDKGRLGAALIADTVTAKWSKGADVPPMGHSNGNLVPVSIEIGPSGAREVDVNPTLDTRAKDGPIRNQLAGAVLQPVTYADVAPTLTSNGDAHTGYRDEHGLVPVAFHPTQDPISSQDVCHAIGANENATAAVMQPIAVPKVTATLLSSAAGFSRTGGSVTEHETYIPMAAYPAAQKEVTLDNTHAVMQSIPFGVGESPDLGHCLRSSASKADKHESTTYVTQVIPIDTMNHIGRGDAHSFSDFQPGAPSYTLTKHHSHAVAFTGGVDYENNGHDPDEPTGPLLKGSPTGGGRPLPAISLPSMQVRRLTPMECERLQGFPDGYTNIPWRGKPESPDGPRYKALGNSWAVPCVQWIGRRIQQGVQGKVPS